MPTGGTRSQFCINYLCVPGGGLSIARKRDIQPKETRNRKEEVPLLPSPTFHDAPKILNLQASSSEMLNLRYHLFLFFEESFGECCYDGSEPKFAETHIPELERCD
jgi:hypothetical protein